MNKIGKGRGLFLKQGLKEFTTNGSFFPSSKFLGKKMLKNVDMKDGVCIVELGAGTGAFTKQILDILPQNGKLIVFEINPKLADFLRKSFRDRRVFIVEGDAKDIGRYINKLFEDREVSEKIENIDYIISGLPLGTFSRKLRSEILKSIQMSLGKNGAYLQFQYFMANFLQIKKMFDAKIIGYEYRNLPPAFVYFCKNK